jgi:gliding motility-associated lipoprotein GldH
MKINFVALSLCLALLLSACGPNYVYKHKTTFSNDTWTYQEVQQHTVEINDLKHLYNLIIGVKHSPDFAFQNLYVKIKTIFPKGESREQIVSLNLADGSGAWFGDCSGQTCSLDIPIQQNAIFETPGKYQFIIEQYMRTEKIAGVKGLSFKVEKTNELVENAKKK